MTKDELLRWVADNVPDYITFPAGDAPDAYAFNITAFTDALWGYWVSQSKKRPGHGDQ